MTDHKAGFPIKVVIFCLEKYTCHTEPLGSLNYKHNMNKHNWEHKIKSMDERVVPGTEPRGWQRKRN